jgi:hypothetical protein
MKRFIAFCILALLVMSIWWFGAMTSQVQALTEVNLTSPTDSSKVTTSTPEFAWSSIPPARETITKFHIMLATDVNFTSVVWDDSTIGATLRKKVYDGPPLTEWTAYYWRMRVQIDSLKNDDTHVIYWQEEYTLPLTFFHFTTKVIQIYKDPQVTHLPNIQTALIWAASGDTVWVDTGTYYENLRFYKKGVVLTSRCKDGLDTAWIKHTVIDGSKLTRGIDNGSVIYFTPGVDSTSTLLGFTIRGGMGRKIKIGTEETINGGGIFCDVGSTPTIKYNLITENQAEDNGGGIFIYSGAPNILQNMIINNSAANGSGGGIECYYSIEVKASPSKGLSGQEGEGEADKTRQNLSEQEMKNLLNPKDDTEAASITAPGTLAKFAQNNPPVAEWEWEARRDTVIVRDKYLVGDTIFFDASASYDPDYPADSIRFYEFMRFRYYKCWDDPPSSPNRMNTDLTAPTFIFPITGSETGLLDFFLRLTDYNSTRGYSDTITVSVQHPPHVEVVESVVGGAPGDTIWFDGTGSCDVNPTDTLQYSWTLVSAPSGVTVTIENADSVIAYFVPEDSTYLGSYEFQLKVSDDMASDSATVQATVSRPPIPVCQDHPLFGDTLVGFVKSDTFTLDASACYDPDPGDSVKYYLWEAGRWMYIDQFGDTVFLPAPISPAVSTFDTTKAVQKFRFIGDRGGLVKFRLRARDKYGVRSTVYDSLIFSIQIGAVPEAGNDTIVFPGTRAYLKGSAIELNPDQRDSLKYFWKWMKQQGSETIDPGNTPQEVSFRASQSGVYKLSLEVYDNYALSEIDSVTVVSNRRPKAIVVHVNHAFEGDTVLLDASQSYDPDSGAFQHPDSGHGGPLLFTWNTYSYPPKAEAPTIVDGNKSVAKFVPYGTGDYLFKVLVNDTISVYQPASDTVNIAICTVHVDSTYAYPIIQGNLIAHNYAGLRGGGIDCNQSSPNVKNNILFKNQSQRSGGAICCRNFSTPQVENNIVFGNISSDSSGGGVADLKAQLSPSSTRGFRKFLGIKKNCFWDNRGGALYNATGQISGNLYSFPRLIDPDFGDFRLECSSPCGDSIGSLVFFQPCYSVPGLSMVTMALMQNPVATAVAHLVINTNAPLKAPPRAYVCMGGSAPSPVYFQALSPNAFKGTHIFTGSGDAEISVFYSSLLEDEDTLTSTVSVQLIGTEGGGTLTSSDQKIAAFFPQGSVKDDIYATCISVSKEPQYQFVPAGEMVTMGEVYQLGPAISFDSDLTVSFPLNGLDLNDKDKTLLAVYRYENGRWIRLESFLEENRVCAKVKDLGIFRLIYDPVGKHLAGIPERFELFQNHPNPFNPETQIRYDLPVSGHVKLSIYNVLGQRVRILVDEMQDAGHKSVIWDGRDNSGQEVASGIYFYKISAENYRKTKKMVLLK